MENWNWETCDRKSFPEKMEIFLLNKIISCQSIISAKMHNINGLNLPVDTTLETLTDFLMKIMLWYLIIVKTEKWINGCCCKYFELENI